MPTIQNRRATAAQWTTANPVLAAGEIGFELDTNSVKIGDGLTDWIDLPYLSDESLTELIETGRLSEAALNDVYAQGRVGGSAIAGVTVDTTGPHVRDTFGGFLWGAQDGNIVKSTDGQNWTVHCSNPGFSKILPCGDGEVLLASTESIRRSSGWESGAPTWETVLSVNPGGVFTRFNVDGDGTKFIATQYSGEGTYSASRYGHISLDGGKTWTLVWDTVERFGETLANSSHIHGCCYDPWSDRFYIAEGHGAEIAGIYTSTDDGATWTRHPGMVQNPAPTVMVATDDGLCCGSDASVGGLHGVHRTVDPALEVIRPIKVWASGENGSSTFATGGVRDPETGLVWMGFYVGQPGIMPRIMVGNASQGDVAWEWTGTSVSGDQVSDAVPFKGRLFGAIIRSVSGSQVISRLRGQIVGPFPPRTVDSGNILGGWAEDGTSLSLGARSRATMGNTSLGIRAEATGPLSFAAGFKSKAVGDTSMGIGRESEATGQGSMGFGYQTKALANATTVIGHQASAASTAAYSTVSGRSAKATGYGAVVSGFSAQVLSDHGLAFGNGAKVEASANGAIALGTGATAKEGHSNAVVIGTNYVSTAGNQVQLGGRHIELASVGNPSSPATGRGRLYVHDNAGSLELRLALPGGVTRRVVLEAA